MEDFAFRRPDQECGNLEGMPCKMDKDEVLHLERTVPENDWARNHVFHPMMIHAFACDGHEVGIYPSCRLGPSQMLRTCTSHQLKQKQQTRTLNNRAVDCFGCVLPAFSPAQLTSTDHDQEYQKSVPDHIRSNRKFITNISNMVLKTLGMHLSEKFCSLSSDWHISASRSAYSRI